MVGSLVGASVAISVGGGGAVGSSVDAGGIVVAVNGARVGGICVGAWVGASVSVGSCVSVAMGVWDGAGVGEGMSVAVAGGLVATTMTMRVVGEGCGVGAMVSGAHAARMMPQMQNKSERRAFAFKIEMLFMDAIVSQLHFRNCPPHLLACHRT